MKSYEEMSDFEINRAVAVNRGGYQGHVDHVPNGVKESDKESHGMFYVERDYCNNPSDAWPIIVDSCIVLTPCMGRLNGDATGYFEHENPITIEFSHNNKALRAAMIVFLMMQEASK